MSIELTKTGLGEHDLMKYYCVYIMCSSKKNHKYFFEDIIFFWKAIIRSVQNKSPVGVLQKIFSKKFRNIYKKIPVLECPFNKVAGLQAPTLAKFLRTPFYTEHLRWLLLTPSIANSDDYQRFEKKTCKKYLHDVHKCIFWS